MPTIEVSIQRLCIISARPFEDVLRRLTAAIGRPDLNTFHKAIGAAISVSDMEAVVHEAIGPSDLMEFVRFDAGDVLRKGRGGPGPKILRLVVGNPIIMKEMATTVPDAASYAPVTILVDERADGVHLSYDLMASLIAPYGDQIALRVARDLDAKVEALLENAARRRAMRRAVPVSCTSSGSPLRPVPSGMVKCLRRHSSASCAVVRI